MYKSLYEFEKIVILPDTVKNEWDNLLKKLLQVKKRTLLNQSVRLSDDPTLEYFLNSIFDDAGAIKIPKVNFEPLNLSLKTYFAMKWNNVNVRMIEDTKYYYLRGNMYYLAYMNIKIELLVIKILEEIEEIESILSNIKRITNGETSYMNFILLLGLLDNRKNHVLEALSIIHQIQRYTNDLPLTEYEYADLLDYVQSVTDDFYITLLTKQFKRKTMRSLISIRPIIDKMIACLITNKGVLTNKKEIIRKFREASNPYHNALLADKVINDWIQYKHYDTLMGIEYGGIELPFVVNSLARMKGLSCFPLYFVKYSHYSQNGKQKGYSQLSPYGYKNFNKLADREILVLDDNSLTGRTIESVTGLLKIHNAKSIYLGIIGYSGEKRYHQMIMPNHGCINPDILLESTVIVSQSPFTRIYNSKSYKNSNGVFNKIEKRIENNLIRNYPEFSYRE